MKKLIRLTTLAVLGLTLSRPTIVTAAEAEDSSPAAITNTAATNLPGHVTASVGKGEHKITIDVPDTPPRYPLPPDVLARLSPDQIVELEKSRHSSSQMEDILVPVGFFGGTVAIVALVVVYRFRRARMVQETIRVMVEKGTPIPPELLLPPEPRKRPRSDLRSGLGWLGIGLALLIYLSGQGDRLWALGLIPLLIGVAYLVAWKVESKKVQ